MFRERKKAFKWRMCALQWGKALCFYSEKNVVVGGGAVGGMPALIVLL